MALGVSKVWGSAGMGVGGSFGKEMRGKRDEKERKREDTYANKEAT